MGTAEQIVAPVTDALTEIERLREVLIKSGDERVDALIAERMPLIEEARGLQPAVEAFFSKAREAADKERWCGSFEDALASQGFAAEARKHEVAWSCQVTLVVEEVDLKAAVEAKIGDSTANFRMDDDETTDFHIVVQVSGVRTSSQGCVCDEVEGEDIKGALPPWAEGYPVVEWDEVECGGDDDVDW